MATPSDCSMGARIGFAIIGILIGVCVVVVFGVHYHNYNAAAWGLISGFAALYCLLIHIGFKKQWWVDCPQRLRTHMLMGCFVQLAGVVSFVAYIVLAASQNQGLIIYGNGYYVVTVYGFMTWKWGFQVFFFSRSYWRHLTGFYDTYEPVLDAEKPTKPSYYGTTS